MKTLAAGPTPRIILLHGGIYPVHLAMESFGEFLVGMGYPEAKIRDPGTGEWSYSPYDASERLAGRGRVVLRARRAAADDRGP